MAKTHPHIDSPSFAQLEALVKDRPEALANTYLALHELVLSTLKDVVYSVDEVDQVIGYGAHQYGYNGWGMAAISPFSKWVSLTLFKGSDLEDSTELLEGNSAVGMRHIKLTHPEQVAEHGDAIRNILLAASQLII